MGLDADQVIKEAEEDSESVYNRIREAAEWFHEREGEVFERKKSEEKIASDLEIGTELASDLVEELVSDSVDPVVQINNSSGSFVGVVNYSEFESGYAYLDYHDIKGAQKKAVCAVCVQNSDKDSQVRFASSTELRDKKNPDYKELRQEINRHYRKNHDTKLEKIETGATLSAGTTVGGNRVATRNWVNKNNYTDSEAQSAISGSNLSVKTLTVETNTRSATEDIKLNANANISSDTSIFFLNNNGGGRFRFGMGDTIQSGNESYYLDIQGDGTVNAESGPLQENGNRVATRSWVDNSGDADQIDGYDVQKNGSDSNGVINFKT